jgi:hypothetical protein
MQSYPQVTRTTVIGMGRVMGGWVGMVLLVLPGDHS